MKSIAAGSGAIVTGKSLPESWTRPVVNSMILPAHAETSAVETLPTETCCLSEETYCAFYNQGYLLEIAVSEDGSVHVDLQVLDGVIPFDDRVSCIQGGNFEVTYTGFDQSVYSVTDSVNCTSTLIEGFINLPLSDPIAYTATAAQCNVIN